MFINKKNSNKISLTKKGAGTVAPIKEITKKIAAKDNTAAAFNKNILKVISLLKTPTKQKDISSLKTPAAATKQNVQKVEKKNTNQNDTKIKELESKLETKIKKINQKISLFTQAQNHSKKENKTDNKLTLALREKGANIAKLEKQLQEKQRHIENIEKEKALAISNLAKIENQHSTKLSQRAAFSTGQASGVATKKVARKQPLTDLQRKQLGDKTRLYLLVIKTRKHLLSKWIRSEILNNFKIDTIESEEGFLTFKVYKESGRWQHKFRLLWGKILKPELNFADTEILRYTNATCFNYRKDYSQGLSQLQGVLEIYNNEKARLNKLGAAELGLLKDSLEDKNNAFSGNQI